MKKIALFTMGIVCLSFFSNAQITKGSVFIGGNAGVSSSTYETPTDTTEGTSWNVQPSIGLAIKENTLLGINFGYGKTNAGGTEQQGYNAGVFFRKFRPIGKSFYLFGEANVNYTHSKYEQHDLLGGYRIQKMNGIGLNVFPGVSFAASKIFYLEATLNNLISLYYSKTNSEARISSSTPVTKETGNSLGLGFGGGGNTIPLNLGFRFIIPNK